MNSDTFRTVIKSEPYDFKLSYHSKLMFAGSCFTEHIGKRLKELKFKVNINPFGIIYNPISLAESLDFIIENKQFCEKDLVFNNEFWHSFFHHGKFSRTNKKKTLDVINISLSESSEFLIAADFLFVTLGTAWVYYHHKTEQIVANCHKLPASEFKKYLLTENEIVKAFREVIEKIRTINKKLKIIFSVSPVRHLNNGFTENFLSKAMLRTSINKICKSNFETYYFPAYEILIDDLRDYRFYNSDLIHPNHTASGYIFDFFKNTFFSEEAETISGKIQKIISARKHRLFNPETKQSKDFVNNSLKRIRKLKEMYPFLNFDEDEKYFLSVK